MLNSPVKKLQSFRKPENEMTLSLGGIGTGHVSLKSSGALGDFNVINIPDDRFNPFSFFCVKAQSLSENKVFTLESKSDFVNSKISDRFPDFYNVFPLFDRGAMYESFPFCETCFENNDFPGKIHMTAWNPFIINNDADSGIPAVLFEYEVENNTDEEINYTFYVVSEGPCADSYNKFFNSRKDEIKYICLNNSCREGSIYDIKDMCVGVCGNNIRYVENLTGTSGNDAIYKLKDYILHENFEECSNALLSDRCKFGVISSSFALKPDGRDKVRFVISWYCPYFLKSDGSYEKKYYARYFTGADECAYYCLSQWERLYEETDLFRQLLYSSTLPEKLIYDFTSELHELKQASFIRCYNGEIYNFSELYIDKSSLISSYFPRLMALYLERALEKVACNNSALISSLYNYYKLTGDILFLEKVWKYTTEALYKDRKLFSDYDLSDKTLELAKAVKDRKQIDLLTVLYNKNKSDVTKSKNVFHNKGSAFSGICDICGLNVDLYNRYYRIIPDMNYAEKGVFQCILCLGLFVGYIERGIDYIQIKCVKGKAFVREIEAPDVPLKVKCGGFEIGFSAGGNIATLDNDCEINSSRDLLVIFRS